MSNHALILPKELILSIEELCEKNLVLPSDLIRQSIGLPIVQPFLVHPSVFTSKNQTRRMLAILADLWKQSPTHFDLAAKGLGGRERTWFGLSRIEIEGTGSSNKAKQIPGTPWWVSVNCHIHGMVSRIEKIMIPMRFSWDYIQMVAWSINDGKGRLYSKKLSVK